MKISITTPTYNSQATVEETVNSVLSQDYSELEYIVVDGLSTDETINIVGKYKSKITKVVSEKDKGISDAFNKGVKLTTGELLGNINSDDILLPGALTYLADNIHEDTDVIYGKGLRLFANGQTQEYIPLPIEKLYSCMALLHPAVFVRKRAYDKFGVFDLKYKSCMDRELLLRMYKGGAKFQYVDRSLVMYRMGGVSEKNYFRYTLPEREKISIEYGMPILHAKFQTLYVFLKMKIIFLKKTIENILSKKLL